MAKKLTPTNDGEQPKISASLEIILNKDEEEESSPIKTGRKPHPINWDKVEAAMTLGGDLKICAMMGGVHWNTLERRILERYGEGFKEVRSAFMTDRKAMALKALWNQVAKGNWRAIKFANQAFNNLTDRVRDMDDDAEGGESATFRLAYNLNEPPPIDAEFEIKGET